MNGRMEKSTAMGFITVRMVVDTTACSKMIALKERGRIIIRMVLFLMETTKIILSTVRDLFGGQVEESFQATSSKAKSTVRESVPYLMEEF